MTWDKRLNYDEWNLRFRNDIKKLQREKQYFELINKPIPHNINMRLCYVSTLLTQLENGSRISEAIDALLKFRADNKREQNVRARKRRKKESLLLVKIPSIIKKNYLDGSKGLIPKQLKNRISIFAGSHYNINTHSLRYAWIAKMGERNIPANLISKAIRHINIQTIEKYTQEQQADEIKKKFIK
jgi:hypothetical protein